MPDFDLGKIARRALAPIRTSSTARHLSDNTIVRFMQNYPDMDIQAEDEGVLRIEFLPRGRGKKFYVIFDDGKTFEIPGSTPLYVVQEGKRAQQQRARTWKGVGKALGKTTSGITEAVGKKLGVEETTRRSRRRRRGRGKSEIDKYLRLERLRELRELERDLGRRTRR